MSGTTTPILSPQPARPLTSREIARILSGLLGGLAAWCSPTEIVAALDHLHENRAYYLEAWRSWEGMQRR